MEPIRILQCPIGNMNVGGIENMIMQIYRNLDRSKVQFDFVIHDNETNYYEQEIIELGGRIYRIPYISQKPFEHIKEFKKILLEHPEYSIVHIHTTYAIMYFDAKIAKKMGRKVIIHSHNSSATNLHKLFHILYKKKIGRLADYRIACSVIAGKWMFPSNLDFEVWKNAINLENFKFDRVKRNELRAQLGLKDELLIGNVARLSFQKNQSLLIDIYNEYVKSNTNSRLIIIGEGEDEVLLKKKVDKLKLNKKVIFTGNVSNVNEYLMAMDIFCLTSRWEGLGISMIEAQATGNIIVAPDIVSDEIKQFCDVRIVKQTKKMDTWCNAISNSKRLSDTQRIERFYIVKEMGYDIKEQSSIIEKFYLNVETSYRGC